MRNSILTIRENEHYLQDTWREQFLQRVLLLSAIVGFFALIPAIFTTEQPILQGIYIGSFVMLVALILIQFPYIVKAMAFVLLPFLLGFASLTETGIHGDALFFFLAFVTLSSLFIGSRAGFVSILITQVAIVVIGYLILSKNFPLSNASITEGNLIEWISASTAHILVSLIILFALRMLINSFRETQIQALEMQKSQFISQKVLEEIITERTKELSRKTDLLNATFLITHQVATIQDLDRLLNKTVSLVTEFFKCYHVGIYLLNQRGDYVALQAASSEGGKRLLDKGYRLRVGTEGMIGYVAAERKPHISLDVEKDIIFFENPELTETRSELSLPLLISNKVVGVLDLQSSERNAFRYEDIEIFQRMADQIAIAIENARLISESQHVISQLEIITNENTHRNWKTELSAQKPGFHYSVTGLRPIDKTLRTKEKNVLNIPIVLHGQKIGNIALQRKADFHQWTSKEEAIANEVAAQAALALENIRLVESTKERANREQALAAISTRIRETLDLDIVLRTSAREIQKTLNLQEAEIRLFSQDNLNDDDQNREETLS